MLCYGKVYIVVTPYNYSLNKMEVVNLIETNWDNVETLIENMLHQHVRVWEDYDYFIVDKATVLIKVYNEQRLIFTVKAKYNGQKLEVVDVS